MAIIKVFQLMAHLDRLIKSKATGSPQDLAILLRVTERTVYLYIEEFKRLGAPISYNHSLRSYVYDSEFSFRSVIRSRQLPADRE